MKSFRGNNSNLRLRLLAHISVFFVLFFSAVIGQIECNLKNVMYFLSASIVLAFLYFLSSPQEKKEKKDGEQ